MGKLLLLIVGLCSVMSGCSDFETESTELEKLFREGCTSKGGFTVEGVTFSHGGGGGRSVGVTYLCLPKEMLNET